MRATWRWFGPEDPISIPEIRQAGATSVETALSDVSANKPWPAEDIAAMRQAVEHPGGKESGLAWDTLGGIAIHDDIKLGRAGAGERMDAFCETVRRLSGHGVRRILMTVMPLLDWVRTDLCIEMPGGATSLGFDTTDFAVFDLFLLKRQGAREDHTVEAIAAAEARYAAMPASRREALLAMLTRGLPGGPRFYEGAEFRALLAEYNAQSRDQYRQNLADFLGAVAKTCAEEGAILGIHPDDPPMPLCGLPRIASTQEDFDWLFDAVPSRNFGMIFCAGSLGSRAGTDLPAMARRFGPRIHYAHPRRVAFTGEDGSFREAAHLGGDAAFDLYDVLKELCAEEDRRRAAGWSDWEIPYRADHARRMLNDVHAPDHVPGYPRIGLTVATAELRGMIHAIQRNSRDQAS
ncbi:MAG: mannonate dehydratase [Roseovarius sp.]